MSVQEMLDASGGVIRVGKLIGQGGEGAVYEVVAASNRVAKIYHNAISPNRARKIQVMASLYSDVIARVATWPTSLLTTKGRQPIGLLMPRSLGGKDIHKLYSPKSRRSDFVRADLRFLIRVAANTARGFSAVHQLGCVIGDVNHGSVLVGQDATVQLIDCDSFQVRSGGDVFGCEVGVETFTPPELQGINLNGIVRTQNHDAFGLAVLTFLLLFMGRHPFAGRYLGSGDMPIAQAIREGRFAYGARRAQLLMDRPPHTPDLQVMGDSVAQLFEKAFDKGSSVRPSPNEWVAALSDLERNLKQCSNNQSHWHLRGVSCPWCPMEAATGIQLFPFVHTDPISGTIDLNSLWKQIEALTSPGPVPEIAVLPEPTASPDAIDIGRSARRGKIAGFGVSAIFAFLTFAGGFSAPAPLFLFVAAIASFFLIRNFVDRSNAAQGYSTAFNTASSNWSSTEQEWQMRARPAAFDEKKGELLRVKDQLSQLPVLLNQRMQQLKNDQQRIQLEKYLDRIEIEDANIEGIGKGRKQTLASYGIETAADIDYSKLDGVPGFGPKLTNALISWRDGLASRFKFDPARGPDPNDVAKVNNDIALLRRDLEQKLVGGSAQLKQIRSQIMNARAQFSEPVRSVYREYLQAKANLAAAQGKLR
jgi:DNA-binding helix-hairpin-helix protein with protein kinase domain